MNIQNLNLQDISIIVAGVVFIMVLFTTYDMTTIKKMAYQAMLVAKDKAKDGLLKSGKEQKEWVVQIVYARCPKWMKTLFGKTFVENMIEKMYVGALDLLDDGQLNNSIK